MSVVSATSRSEASGVSPSPSDFDAEQASAGLIARMEQVPTSRWFVTARIVMGSATFFDAFNALSIAFVLPILVPLWHITPPEIGILIGASYVGQIIGALAFSWGAERYGRIPCAAAATAIYAVMSLACATAWSFNVLLAFRFIQGIGVGGEMPVAATYISELSKAHGRGRFFMLYEMIFPIGLMVTGQVGAILVPLMGWQIMFLIGGIPGLIIALLLLRLPESPRWLIGKGRLAAADAVVRRLEAAASDKSGAALAAPSTETLPQQVEVPQRSRGRWGELLSPAYRGRTLIAWVLWASAYLVANGLNNWMPTLYTTLYHLELTQALRAASLTNVAQVVLVLICALVIDRTGRKFWMMGAFGMGAVTLGILGFGGAKDVSWLIVLGTISYGLIGSIAAVVYLYTPEIYPTRMRAVGTGVATSWLRIASAIGPALIGLMLGKGGGIDSVFLMFAAVAIVGLIAATRMIETRNLRLEEISR
ncbi:MFS transporter [Bradyrhizobium erythrophlei]|uniref:MFS transporter, putative metabolite:H+ symporter n=1 Tax=Bradyrhizobium erythrophlei TaxID=1437360 RepID=A0A1M7U2D6_9BRAD|nr:MFS transporter [Bradyrhizobium erythrophlei]SHN77047.1 MFS transporter, putative metabolite:H+ symporter [Bradyrhizobium erythrophlei]